MNHNTVHARQLGLAIRNHELNVLWRNEHGQTIVHAVAMRNPDSEIIATLVEAKANINTRCLNGLTALHYAASSNTNLDMVNALLQRIDVNARDKNEQTPLHLAARNSENPEVIQLLLSSGADGKAKDKDENTPFDYVPENTYIMGDKSVVGTPSFNAYWALNDARFD